MKRPSLKLGAGIASIILISCLPVITQYADTTILDTPTRPGIVNPGDSTKISSADVNPGNATYMPVLKAGTLDLLDKSPHHPIINHGHGWYYFPYKDYDLGRACLWFKTVARPDLECVADLTATEVHGQFPLEVPPSVNAAALKHHDGIFLYFQRRARQ